MQTRNRADYTIAGHELVAEGGEEQNPLSW